ncbi:protein DETOXIFICATION 33-like isoform X1 [Syzygium oleosum]|uniref:protein DETOXIFICATION 33-like isoform X1 n=2 Tax=Syzygium oleosum TaxID=219896 RepID=UPI0011D28D36|nr:protein DETOXIFICATION 33-like isoform X1 [Syzygium oleosum]
MVKCLGGGGKVTKKCMKESKKTWEIAAPAILTAVAQFSIGVMTAAFVGYVGDVEFAAVSIVQNVLEGFVYGVMLGMGSALETLCGQAVGAGKLHMLGIYMQRSCIITGVTALLLTPVYIFVSPILQILRQDKHISDLAGKYSVLVIPQLYAYALNFPVQKFLQSQSKVWVMTIISLMALALHGLLNWVLLTKLQYGLKGAAIAGNISWWFLVVAQTIYVVGGFFPVAWTGFSMLAFKSLTSFVKLSLASAIMLCLELWYYTAVILMVGCLKNPEIAVDAISICMNLQTWALMIALGFNASVSVRVSNELGGGDAKAAKFSVLINIFTSTAIGIFFTAAVASTTTVFPKIFSNQQEVITETSKLGYYLAATIFLNSIQPVLHGVAVGAGWQFFVAIVNIGCYYLLGLPIGALLGYRFKLGAVGIWIGMLIGCLSQTVVLLFIIFRANWRKEALQAEIRMRTWGGQSEPPEEPPEITSEPNGTRRLNT